MPVTWIEANAGTGKTYRLTEEMINRLRSGVSYERICAVTFTEKAANEMVDRLRGRVVDLIGRGLAPPSALDLLNESFVGTIHAFCNRILRRYGNRLGLPPLFTVDSEGTVFRDLFDARWDRFVSALLRTPGEHEHLIRILGLQTLRGMAEKLAERRHSIRPMESGDLSWLVHDLQNEERWGLRRGKWVSLLLNALPDFEQNRAVTGIVLDSDVLGDFVRWKNALQDLYRSRHHEFHSALSWLKREFVQRLLEEYRELGYLRFDDMILDTHALLLNDLEVRRELKQRYDVVLVDELQDTDPLQYEIFLFLCEKMGREKDFTLRQVRDGSKKLELEPGKFFGVGDPKQSIYGFRSADIGAYETVKLLLGREGMSVEPLTTNYRSCRNLVRFTNRLAASCFAAAAPRDSEAMRDYCEGRSLLDCVHLVEISSTNANEQHLRVLTEANWLASTVKELVAGAGARRKPQEICILLRKLTSAHLYIDALNARNLRVVIEGERFFYQSQEVIDFVNVLKCVVDDMDHVALAGLLRSPLFGLTDTQVATFFIRLREHDSPQQALTAVLQGAGPLLPALLSFLAAIQETRSLLGMLTPSSLVDEILRRLPVLAVAGIGYGPSRKELAPQNLLKIQKLAREADEDPAMNAYRFVRLLETHSKELKKAGQEPMADEALPAIRIMSIHQSKGLDFPVVFVPLTDYGTGGFEDAAVVRYDWKTDMTGLKVNRIPEANYLRLKYGMDEESPAPEDEILPEIEAEEKRVLYVAATRAREELYFTYVPWFNKKDSAVGRPILNFLGSLLEAEAPGRRCVQQEAGEPWLEAREAGDAGVVAAPGEVVRRWEQYRAQRGRRTRPMYVPVTTEAAAWRDPEVAAHVAGRALITGAICHAVLEDVDFARPAGAADLVQAVRARGIAGDPILVEEACAESREILDSFFRSEAARWLASVQILGREVPLALHQDAANKIISGKIDLLAQEGDSLVLVDYKTNVALDEDSLQTYTRQMNLYALGLQPLTAGRPLRKRLCMLRTGAFVEIP